MTQYSTSTSTSMYATGERRRSIGCSNGRMIDSIASSSSNKKPPRRSSLATYIDKPRDSNRDERFTDGNTTTCSVHSTPETAKTSQYMKSKVGKRACFTGKNFTQQVVPTTVVPKEDDCSFITDCFEFEELDWDAMESTTSSKESPVETIDNKAGGNYRTAMNVEKSKRRASLSDCPSNRKQINSEDSFVTATNKDQPYVSKRNGRRRASLGVVIPGRKLYNHIEVTDEEVNYQKSMTKGRRSSRNVSVYRRSSNSSYNEVDEGPPSRSFVGKEEESVDSLTSYGHGGHQDVDVFEFCVDL